MEHVISYLSMLFQITDFTIVQSIALNDQGALISRDIVLVYLPSESTVRDMGYFGISDWVAGQG